MSWNYRRVHHETPRGDFYAIHEIHYEEGTSRIVAWTENPSYPSGETPEELHDDMMFYGEAFIHPALKANDLPHATKITPKETH